MQETKGRAIRLNSIAYIRSLPRTNIAIVFSQPITFRSPSKRRASSRNNHGSMHTNRERERVSLREQTSNNHWHLSPFILFCLIELDEERLGIVFYYVRSSKFVINSVQLTIGCRRVHELAGLAPDSSFRGKKNPSSSGEKKKVECKFEERVQPSSPGHPTSSRLDLDHVDEGCSSEQLLNKHHL
jgi:hypothetical protein